MSSVEHTMSASKIRVMQTEHPACQHSSKPITMNQVLALIALTFKNDCEP